MRRRPFLKRMAFVALASAFVSVERLLPSVADRRQVFVSAMDEMLEAQHAKNRLFARTMNGMRWPDIRADDYVFRAIT